MLRVAHTLSYRLLFAVFRSRLVENTGTYVSIFLNWWPWILGTEKEEWCPKVDTPGSGLLPMRRNLYLGAAGNITWGQIFPSRNSIPSSQRENRHWNGDQFPALAQDGFLKPIFGLVHNNALIEYDICYYAQMWTLPFVPVLSATLIKSCPVPFDIKSSF